MCRKSLVEPGSQAERAQAQELELQDAIFLPGANIDLQRILSGESGADFSRVFGQQSREEGSGSRSDYAGLYS